MEIVKGIVETLLFIRQEEGVKLRYPCIKAVIVPKEKMNKIEDFLDIINNQANIKTTEFLKKLPEKKTIKFKERPECWVGLETEITDDLKAERISRELTRHVQQTRKKNKFHVKENIELIITCEKPGILNQLIKFKEMIASITKAKDIQIVKSAPEKVKKDFISGKLSIDNVDIKFYFKKSSNNKK